MRLFYGALALGIDAFYVDESLVDFAAENNYYFQNYFNCPIGNAASACPRDLRQICGSDGFGYSNPCLLRANYCLGNRNLRFKHWGDCEEEAESPDLVHDFIQWDCNPACTRDYAPVCGTNGETYSNECTFKYQMCSSGNPDNVEIDFEGECCPRNCHRMLSQVCGSDDNTYGNTCELRRASCARLEKDPEAGKITVRGEGHCMLLDFVEVEEPEEPREIPCPGGCGRNYFPVCGSDGRTHSNECMMEQAACDRQIEITMVHEGECTEMVNDIPVDTTEAPEIECPGICHRMYAPVCGSDDKTHSNECMMELAACESQTEIHIKHEGECEADKKSPFGGFFDDFEEEPGMVNDAVGMDEEEPEEIECPGLCDRMGAPVCGSDGVTYGSECMMQLHSCTVQIRITKKHRGACMLNDPSQGGFGGDVEEEEEELEELPEDCSELFEINCNLYPDESICASNGIKYTNKCFFKKGKCAYNELRRRKAKFCKTKNRGVDSIFGRIWGK